MECSGKKPRAPQERSVSSSQDLTLDTEGGLDRQVDLITSGAWSCSSDGETVWRMYTEKELSPGSTEAKPGRQSEIPHGGRNIFKIECSESGHLELETLEYWAQ